MTSRPLVQGIPTDCCMWSRNIKNEEAMDHVGPQRHGGGIYIYIYRGRRCGLNECGEESGLILGFYEHLRPP